MKIDYPDKTGNDGLDRWLERLVDKLRFPDTFEANTVILQTARIDNLNSGYIGGWQITENTLYNDPISIDAANRRITVEDIVLDGVENEIRIADNILIDADSERIDVGDTDGTYVQIDGANTRVRSSNYTSGFLGTGFTLEPTLLEVGNIRCRGALQTVTFETQSVHAYGGALVVVKGADVLATAMTAADDSYLEIENKSAANTWATGDVLRITVSDGAGSVTEEWLSITGKVGNIYTVTRDRASSFSADNNPAWPIGTAVTNWGQSGDGGVAIWGYGSTAPYLQMFTHAGSPWTTISTWARLGNLNNTYGIGANDYYGLGLGASDKSGNYLIWDHNSGDLNIKGSITITGGSGISNLTDAGDLATQDTVGAGDCDETIITGGKIITSLLTATNIQTGTLTADGTLTIDVTGSGALEIKSGGTMQIESGAEMDVQSGGYLDIEAGGYMRIYGTDGIEIKSGGNIQVESGGMIDIESGGNFYLRSGGNMSIDSGGLLTVSAANGITLASGGDILVQNGADFLVDGGGDVILQRGSSSNVSILHLKDGDENSTTIPAQIRFEDNSDDTIYFQMYKREVSATIHSLWLGPSEAGTAYNHFMHIGASKTGATTYYIDALYLYGEAIALGHDAGGSIRYTLVSDYSNGYIELGAPSHYVRISEMETSGNEGGEILWEGSGSYDDWITDVYNNNFRFTTNSANNNLVSFNNLSTGRVDLSLTDGGVIFTALTSAPGTPGTGLVVLADGATWDPLTTSAAYAYFVWYDGAAWRGLNQNANGTALS